jgi:hypothetical protein
MTNNEGAYCTICGGMVPAGMQDITQVTVDGKVIGINKLDFILEEVKKLNLSSNYIPTKRKEVYAQTLLNEYNTL